VAVHLLHTEFGEAHNSCRRDILCNILTEFSTAVTVAGLIEMYLYEMHCKLRVGDCRCRTFGQ
jgi:hypothetical protein